MTSINYRYCLAAAALCAIAAFGSLSCSPRVPASGERLTVAVSIYPLYDIARNIAGTDADVIFAVPPGANPHGFEPRPATVRELQKASLFVGVMRPFDGWVEKLLRKDAAVRYLKDSTQNRGGHHDESDPVNNPHIWISVKGAGDISKKFEVFLSGVDPSHAAGYAARLKDYTAHLDALDREVRARLDGCAGRAFVQWHPSWDFFAAEYGLRVAATVEKGEGAGPSVGDFKKLVEKLRAEKVRVIVLDLNARNTTADALAREIGGVIVRLDGLGNPGDPKKSTYIELMKTNAALLADVLKKDAR